MAIPVVAGLLLLVAGAGAAMAMGSGAPLRILNGDCVPPEPPKTEEAALALARRFQEAGIAAANAIGGESALGPPPGDPGRVEMFATAWATEMLFSLAPECMANAGIPRDFGAGYNEFGPDIDEYEGDVPPAIADIGRTLVAAVLMELELRGYAVERSAGAGDTENPIGDALVELLLRPRTQLAVRVAGAHRYSRHRGRAQTMRRR